MVFTMKSGIYNELWERIVEDVDLIYKKEKKRKGKKTYLFSLLAFDPFATTYFFSEDLQVWRIGCSSP